MRRILIISLVVVLCATSSFVEAQTVMAVLDKCAAQLSSKDGVRASFSMKSAQIGDNLSGEIAFKGSKFYAATPIATIWFDGTTQWTYLNRNDEVNIVTPTQEQLQTINPYTFIYMYKKGYKLSMTTSSTAYNVHLEAENSKQNVSEVFILVDKRTYEPVEIKVLRGSNWTSFYISNLKTAKLDDSMFRFNSKDFPLAEIVDLR